MWYHIGYNIYLDIYMSMRIVPLFKMYGIAAETHMKKSDLLRDLFKILMSTNDWMHNKHNVIILTSTFRSRTILKLKCKSVLRVSRFVLHRSYILVIII